MSEKKNNLLALVQKHQNKKSKLYFGISTCISLLSKNSPTDLFIISFGKKPNLPKPIINIHIKSYKGNPQKFISNQPLKLDTLMVSLKDNSIIDPHGAISDFEKGIIQTTESPYKIIKKQPHLIIRIAALVSETGFTPTSSVIQTIKENKDKLVGNKFIWREFRRLLRADLPSLGIEFLRKVGALKIILPELNSCYGVKQNEAYHKFTVYEHCLFACNSCDREDIRIRMAALIHDVGKPMTKGRNENGITFHKHEVEGTKLAKKIMSRLGINKKDSAFIINLVKYHMYQYDRKWKDSTVKNFVKKVGVTKLYKDNLSEFPLFKLRQADRLGRGIKPITQKQLDFEERMHSLLWGEE